MLGAALEENSDRDEEQIFQRALALEPHARAAFVREAACGNEKLCSAVLLLLEGYEESGGDAAQSTQAEGLTNRAQWIANEEPGMMIGHFRLVRSLGEGGMGSVWRAEQTTPVKRTVALKVIKLGMDTREVVKRFERERQTLALLNHPNIAKVFEAGATAWGRPYFVMELAEGESITSYCRNNKLGVEAILRLFREVCAAVEHAHQKGIIHRDLKPSNILVVEGAVKVIDFGVAKATQGTEDNFLTQHSGVVGTPAYMSPEQVRTGGVEVDTRTDVYALGVVLYELLTGTLPIEFTRLESNSLPEMQRIILEKDPPAPSTRLKALAAQGKIASASTSSNHTLPRELDRVVMKAIRKERDERYASAAALSEDLRCYLAGEPVAAVTPTAAYYIRKFVQRHRVIVGAGVAVFVSLLAGLIVSLIEVRQANRALAGEERAREEVTFTLADMYAQSGLTAAENQDATRAELWFANAAVIGAKDAERVAANRLRATAWRQDTATPVRAFETGYEHMHDFSWNPRHPALIVQGESKNSAQIWNLENEQQWQPALDSAVIHAAWDSSGERVALLMQDGTLAVREFPSGKELARIASVHSICVEWSPDGRWIGAANFLWDWRKNERLALAANAGCIRFSRDGELILLQWDDRTGICALADPGHFLFPPVPAHPSGHSDFLGDQRSFVVGEPKGGLTIYDSITGTASSSYTNGISAAEVGIPVSVSPDGRCIARRNFPMLDRADPGRAKFPIHDGNFNTARFSPDGTLLASGGYDNRLELWSAHDGRFLGEIGHHHTAVINLEFSPNGDFLASGEDGLVRVWRIRHFELTRKIPVDGSTLAVISPDGKYVAASGFGNYRSNIRQTQLYEIATGQAIGPKTVPEGLILDASFGRDGSWIALAVSTTTDRGMSAWEKNNGGSGNIQLWDAVAGKRLGDPIPMPSEPRGLCMHPTENILGVCCAGGEGVEINLANRSTRVLFHHHESANAGATLNNGRCGYSADGRVFAMWGLFRFIHLWDRQQKKELMQPFERETTTFDLAFFGSTVARAVVAPSMRIEFHHLHTGVETVPAIPYVNWPFLTRFSEDGKLLLTAGGGRTAQVWDWRQGKLACPMLPHDETIMAGCFVNGTPWVITGGHDGKIKFWDSRTGMMIRPPLLCNGWVLDLKMTPDARTLIASGSLNGGIELIDLQKILPLPELPAAGARLLSEIDADAEVLPGGGLAKLTPQAWLKKWQEFRRQYPAYPGHRLNE